MGNSEALMMACVSSVHSNIEQTVSTLRFASLAKTVQLQPRLQHVSQIEVDDPMANDMDDPDEHLNRRTIWIEVPGFGDVFARCLGMSPLFLPPPLRVRIYI
jgi:hypothetical protein